MTHDLSPLLSGFILIAVAWGVKAFALPATRLLVIDWVRVYTFGLSAEQRERRLREIQSDLWEHEAQLKSEGYGPHLVALHIFCLRFLPGILADLSWGLEGSGRTWRDVRKMWVPIQFATVMPLAPFVFPYLFDSPMMVTLDVIISVQLIFRVWDEWQRIPADLWDRWIRSPGAEERLAAEAEALAWIMTHPSVLSMLLGAANRFRHRRAQGDL